MVKCPWLQLARLVHIDIEARVLDRGSDPRIARRD